MKKYRVHIIISMKEAFGRRLVEGIADYVHRREDWECRLTDCHRSADLSRVDTGPSGADAIIGAITPAIARKWKGKARRFIVNVSSASHVKGANNVVPDNKAVGQVAAEYLLDKNLNHLAYIGPVRPSARHDGFARFARRKGRKISVFNTDYDYVLTPQWEESTAAWLSGLPKPCGVLAYNDIIASHLVTVAAHCGIEVPVELAVMGVDNDPLRSLFTSVPITSVDPDFRKLGRTSARVLDEMFMNDAEPVKSILIPPMEVVERDSTDFPETSDRLAVRAARVIRDRACSGLPVGQIIRPIPGTRRTIERHFDKAFGRSLHDEVTRVRILEARRLLKRTHMPLTLIAARVGYEDMRHFLTVFRKKMGVPPGVYRRKDRKVR
ncbi:MAG: substrate-binding domain-containing protein [Kiritimatiellia bacterium]